YLSAGQRCTAARRLIVEDGKHERLIESMKKLIDRIIVAQPFADPQPFMGPVIDLAAADHVQEQWLNLMMKGGKPIARLDRPSAFYAADYCAYPVTSSEADRARATLGEGLRDPNMQED